MADRARKILEDAMTLSDGERLELAEQLFSSVPTDAAHLAELEHRARRAIADPHGGESWDVVKRRLSARFAAR
ncbi:MAG TPA: addiction module protein [Kofleriaceae bacterium]